VCRQRGPGRGELCGNRALSAGETPVLPLAGISHGRASAIIAVARSLCPDSTASGAAGLCPLAAFAYRKAVQPAREVPSLRRSGAVRPIAAQKKQSRCTAGWEWTKEWQSCQIDLTQGIIVTTNQDRVRAAGLAASCLSRHHNRNGLRQGIAIALPAACTPGRRGRRAGAD
jgi:hypothetical protein